MSMLEFSSIETLGGSSTSSTNTPAGTTKYTVASSKAVEILSAESLGVNLWYSINGWTTSPMRDLKGVWLKAGDTIQLHDHWDASGVTPHPAGFFLSLKVYSIVNALPCCS